MGAAFVVVVVAPVVVPETLAAGNFSVDANEAADARIGLFMLTFGMVEAVVAAIGGRIMAPPGFAGEIILTVFPEVFALASLPAVS